MRIWRMDGPASDMFRERLRVAGADDERLSLTGDTPIAETRGRSLPAVHSILLVEDNDDLRELAGGILQRAGYRVFEAEHGQAALELLSRMPERPSLVLLDLMMPVMSGFELLEVLRNSSHWASLPVVVLSAIADRARPEGASAYIQKPLNPAELLGVVASFSSHPQ